VSECLAARVLGAFSDSKTVKIRLTNIVKEGDIVGSPNF